MEWVGEHTGIDWSGCAAVERVPGRVSGVPVLRDSRIPADFLVMNEDGGSPIEEILENFEADPILIRTVLRYAAEYRHRQTIAA